MKRRGSLDIAAALATLVAATTALAQDSTGSVTTVPAHQAPALGVPLFIVLALALAGIAMYRLRRRSLVAPIVGLVLVSTLLAGLGYAVSFVMISGAQCVQQTTSTFVPADPTELESQCPNPIQIVDIEVSCNPVEAPSRPDPNTPPACAVGLILNQVKSCMLPRCV